ncbi:uncharacterized protein [Watersipora subatra]|uniref:uncharacterized protein isoform X2 n=1 Tax=Watersipora subatra TaxID=2589382 RepID=UPI00355BC700
MSNSEELRPWRFEPDALSEEEDPQQNQTSQQELIPPATEWCVCKRCQDMPSLPECLCCHDAEFAHRLHDRGEHECLCTHPGVDELVAPAPLELGWNNYLRYHKANAVAWYRDVQERQKTEVLRKASARKQ